MTVCSMDWHARQRPCGPAQGWQHACGRDAGHPGCCVCWSCEVRHDSSVKHTHSLIDRQIHNQLMRRAEALELTVADVIDQVLRAYLQ